MDEEQGAAEMADGTEGGLIYTQSSLACPTRPKCALLIVTLPSLATNGGRA